MLPNFIGVGTQRAATTWLHYCLAEHPQVFVPQAKELHYFSNAFDRGQAWYESHFTPAAGQHAVGEITPNYLHHDRAIDRIADVIPDAKLIIVLREPVSRAYSAYQLFRERHYADRTFAQACIMGSDLVHHSIYSDALERLFARFDRQQIRVYLYDDIQADGLAVLRDLYAFVGVDPSFVPTTLRQRVNTTVLPRTQKVLRRIGAGRAIDAVRGTWMGEWIKRRFALSGSNAGQDNDLPADARLRLQRLFQDDVDRVQRLIGRDLSRWRAA